MLTKYMPDISMIVQRFPVPLAASMALFAFFNLFIIGGAGTRFPENEVAAGVAAFLASGAGHLFAEAHDWKVGRNLLIAVVMGALAGSTLIFAKVLGTSWEFLVLGLTLMLLITVGFSRGASQSSLWLFGFRLVQSAALAILVGIICAGGLSAVAAGLDFLLGVSIDGDTYQRIWSIGIILVGPLFGLSLVPSEMREEPRFSSNRASLLENGIYVLVNYVLVPLVVIYAVILHAYALKILWLNSLPRGEIGIMVSLFALGGTATWLMAWPWRDAGNRLLRVFMQYWFWLIPVPVILLTIAISRRIADYGITPDRYAIALVAIWTITVFAYLTIRRNLADIRFVLGSAAVLFLMGSMGPWGAHSLTERSQLTRLQELLAGAGVLENGVVTEHASKLSSEQAQQARSILLSLVDVGGETSILPWLGKKSVAVQSLTGGDWQITEAYADALGISSSMTGFTNIDFVARLPLDQRISGNARLLGPFKVYVSEDQVAVDTGFAKVSSNTTDITVKVDATDYKVSKKQLLERAKSLSSGATSDQLPFSTVLDEGADMLVSELHGLDGSESRINEIHFWIIQRQ